MTDTANGGPNGIKRSGFGSMSTERLSEISGKGGRRAHELGKAHKWNSEEARAAAKKSADGRKRTPPGPHNG